MRAGKLIFINRFYDPDESATAHLLTDLCRHLAAQRWDVRVITSNRRRDDLTVRLKPLETLEGVEVRRVWSTNFGRAGRIRGRVLDYLLFYPAALVSLLMLSRRGDVIIVKTDPPLISSVALLASKLRGAYLVNWIQDLYPEVAIELGVPWLRGGLGKFLVRIRNLALKRADANVVIGAGMASRLRKMGVEEDTIHLLPNWSDDHTITPLDASQSLTRQSWGIKDDVFVFAYSGNFGRAHESETILQAAKLLRHRKDICFLFVGGGHENQVLRRAVIDAGLENFLFKPHQSREALSDSLAAADAHWLSLRRELEGLIVPSKFYGIASAGRPIVAVTAHDGEIARVIDELGCGYVVEPGDGERLAAVISALSSNHDSRRELGARARRGSDDVYARRLALRRWEWILADAVLTKRRAPQVDLKHQSMMPSHPEPDIPQTGPGGGDLRRASRVVANWNRE